MRRKKPDRFVFFIHNSLKELSLFQNPVGAATPAEPMKQAPGKTGKAGFSTKFKATGQARLAFPKLKFWNSFQYSTPSPKYP
jgi:hypothetical protein